MSAVIGRNLEFCYGAFPLLKERRHRLDVRRAAADGGDRPCPDVGAEAPVGRRAFGGARGMTVLMAEQNLHQAIRIADRGYIIVRGEVVFHGHSAVELQQNELVKTYYLGA